MTPQAWVLLIALVITIIGCYGIDRQNSRLIEENKQLKNALRKKRSRYLSGTRNRIGERSV